MKIRISTDSTADIPVSLQRDLDIPVLPLTIETVEGQEWMDGIDVTTDSFADYLEKAEQLPTTAAVPPLDYVNLFEDTFAAGYTDLIHVSLNGSGSSTFQNSILAREMFYQDHPDSENSFRIHLLDSRTYSMGYGLGVIHAALMAREENASVDRILEYLEDWIAHNVVLFVPLELSFVRKSGRISGAAALIGDALGLKPVITFEDGSAKTLEKARGEKMAMRSVIRLMNATRSPGTPISIVGGADPSVNAAWDAMVRKEITDTSEIVAAQLGCVITINSGPKAFGIIYRI
ncbi:MAG: DegV family protein [Lachnospiraceae bacterium]|nr:DegV family protein [Lachnospiraceae bacterium]